MDPLPPENAAARLPPPRFGMRTILMVVTIIGMLLGLAVGVSPYVAAVACLFTLAIAAHMAGNAIGMQLQQLGNQERRSKPKGEAASASLSETDFAPATQLRHHKPLSAGIFITTSIGAGGGLLLGAVFFAALLWNEISLLLVASGAIAFAILGGIAAFLFSSFLTVLLGACQQAASSHTTPLAETEQIEDH